LVPLDYDSYNLPKQFFPKLKFAINKARLIIRNLLITNYYYNINYEKTNSTIQLGEMESMDGVANW